MLSLGALGSFGPSLVTLGVVLAFFGDLWGTFGWDTFGWLWVSFELPWVALGGLWAPFGWLLGSFGRPWVAFGSSLGAFWFHVGLLWRAKHEKGDFSELYVFLTENYVFRGSGRPKGSQHGTKEGKNDTQEGQNETSGREYAKVGQRKAKDGGQNPRTPPRWAQGGGLASPKAPKVICDTLSRARGKPKHGHPELPGKF